ncbi:MAG: RecQ family ATP-dependent DNA helicase [Oscillospiraceae bacterium]|nr:RecQ family ATP-dependent DNA helicase [Oscillospiraceae bacterium]
MTQTKHTILTKYFGYTEFREGQGEIIDQILSGRDSIGIMPTGSGKSICYQIPALLFDGITVVISPLISLMKDQVHSMTQSGIDAAYINSSLSYYEYNDIINGAKNGLYKIVYAAPERLNSGNFLEFVMNADISLVAVDESHCVSQWGHDFRPSYLMITDFIAKLKKRPVVCAFTATATSEVRDDIIRILELCDPFVITTGFDRKNLNFEVIKPKAKMTSLCEILSDKKNKCGIIYCLTRKTVEEVCYNLNAIGFSATRYHAGLSDDERRMNQDDFIYDRKSIMVATNAFGMGIDKSNVAYVIHYNMPKNIENYYQEAGRAGRDGTHADCIILYNEQDVRINSFLIDNTEPNPNITPAVQQAIKNKDYDRLYQIKRYCNLTSCLREYILKYFGDTPPAKCDNCSNCKRVAPVATTTKKTEFKDNELFKRLKELRNQLAKAIGIPAYTIFTDAVLHEMCSKLPRSLSEMNSISGIGTVKLNRYGYKFLKVITSYLEEGAKPKQQESDDFWKF